MVKFASTPEEFRQILASNKIVIVDYTASWCPPCKMIAPHFEKLATENTAITFIKVDVDELQEISQWAGVTAMPTFVVYVDGEQKDQLRGASVPRLQELVQKFVEAATV